VQNFIGDLLFGGFVIILLVILINDSENAVNLLGGTAKVYTGSVRTLAQVNKPA
jgi:hypothetical protein